MKIVYSILILALSLTLLSCGGTADEEEAAPPPEAVETEAAEPSRAEAGENPGEFTLDDANITLLGREPREGSQVLAFVYYRPLASEVRTFDIVQNLNPRLSVTGSEPAPHTTWKDTEEFSFGDTEGVIFEMLFPEMEGDCVLTASTATGPVTVELGDAVKTYRYTERVRPGKKAFVTPWPGRFPIFEGEFPPGRHPMIKDELEEGDIVFPTGELELATVNDEDGNIVGEPTLFREVDTMEDENDWVIADDEVFEYAGYMEAGGE